MVASQTDRRRPSTAQKPASIKLHRVGDIWMSAWAEVSRGRKWATLLLAIVWVVATIAAVEIVGVVDLQSLAADQSGRLRLGAGAIVFLVIANIASAFSASCFVL